METSSPPGPDDPIVGPSLLPHPHVNNNHSRNKGAKASTGGAEDIFCDPEEAEDKQQEEFFSLRWNDFYPNLLNTFSDLRDSEELTDVTIAVTSDGQHSFKAHKVILSAISPFFRQILKDNPCQHPIIILKDISRFEMENLLTFIYQGEVQIANNDLNKFLKTAQSLRVKGLTDCSKLENQENNTSSSSQNKSSKQQINNHQNNISSKGDDNNGEKKHSNSSNKKRGKKRRRHQSRQNLKFMNLNDQDQEQEQDLRINTQQQQLQQQNDFDPSDPSDLDMELDEQPNISQQFERSDASDIDYDDDDDGQMMQPEIRLLESSQPSSSSPPGDNKSILVQALLQQKDNSVKNYSIADRKDDDSNSLVMDQDFISSIENESNSTKIAAAALLGFHHQAIHQQQQQQQALPLITTTNPSSLSALDFQSNKSGRGHQTSDRQIISNNNSLLMNERVRATDPRPCPKCSKIYRSAHTLRTHLEDKHTICPGYRCVLCGTVAKSRNSLHSHMSRQHRGISTKDLPVLPMPSAFDPQLAARLLKKAGLKMSHSEGSGGDGSGGNSPLSPGERGKNPHRSKRSRRSAGTDDEDEQAVNQTTGSVILDTYLQFIAENSQAAVQRLLSSHGQTLEQFQNANNLQITNAIANIPQSVSVSSVSNANNNPGIGGVGIGVGKRQKLSNNNKVLKSNNNNSDEIISPTSEDIIGSRSMIDEMKSQKKNNNKTKSLEELESNNISSSTNTNSIDIDDKK